MAAHSWYVVPFLFLGLTGYRVAVAEAEPQAVSPSAATTVAKATDTQAATAESPQARLPDAKAGSLWVQSTDGTFHEVPIERLSDSARAHIETLAKMRTIDDAAIESDRIQVTLRGLCINKPAPAPPKPGGSEEVASSVYSTRTDETTQLTLMVTSPKQQIVSMDRRASKIAQFTDDLGTDLNRGPYNLSFEAGKGHGGHQSSVQVTFFQTPAPRATRLTLKGNLVLLCVSGEKTIERVFDTSNKETQILLGKTEIALTIRQVGGQVTTADNKTIDIHTTQIQLQSKDPMDFIRSIEFFGPDGKQRRPHGSFGSGGGKFASPGSTTYTEYYNLPERLDSWKVKISYYENNESVIVPVDIEAGLGF